MVRKAIGGNSGYIGYSESKRSAEAKNNGKFPKTLFKKEYGITEKKFQELLDKKIIYESEWHHTSKFGNKTVFYAIDDQILFNFFTGNKEEAFKLYKKTRNYEAKTPTNKKYLPAKYNYSVIFKKGDELDYLLSINSPYVLTGRKNYNFGFKKELLKYPKYRKIFLRGYKSENLVGN